MGDHTDLRSFFGCEIEIPLKRELLLEGVEGIEEVEDEQQREVKAVNQLIIRLQKAGLDVAYETGDEQFTQWVVGTDPTIGAFSPDAFRGCAHFCSVNLPCEIRSPALDVDRPELYDGLKVVWEVVKQFQVEEAYWWKGCDFHIHFSHHEPLIPGKGEVAGPAGDLHSPDANRYPLPMAQKVCCSVYFLERALMQLMPWQSLKLRGPGKWKYNEQYAKRNKIDDNLASSFKSIMSSNTNEDLAAKFCPTDDKNWKLNVRGYRKKFVTMEIRICTYLFLYDFATHE
ncbi:hypothetical protein F5Y18DRAFT_410528 [Xylariaceae sp. FL1019]|nr:hypothetical protein F5Y18DRAFT_410528 [Xylariaceae sp. FL1019]